MLGRKKKEEEEEEFGFGDVDTSSFGATADDRKHPAPLRVIIDFLACVRVLPGMSAF
jgi:hypothetical protein